MLLLLFALLLVGPWSTSPLLNPAQLPLVAAAPGAFVPPGWTVERTSVGDLNGDRLADQALMLLEPVPMLDPLGKRPDRHRVLLVILAQPQGTWKRVAVGLNTLRCTECFGMFSPDVPEVDITHGILEIAHEYGATHYDTQLQRLRYEPLTGRLRLIGEEFNEVDRVSGVYVHSSTNLLTGRQTLQKGRTDESKAHTAHQRRVKVPKVYIEDLDYQAEPATWWPVELK
jgi:hypothetical protein